MPAAGSDRASSDERAIAPRLTPPPARKERRAIAGGRGAAVGGDFMRDLPKRQNDSFSVTGFGFGTYNESVENRRPAARSPLQGLAALRVILVLSQAMAIGLTWQLWQVRTGSGDAPNLPIVDANWMDAIQFNFGWLLLASL